MVIHFGMAPNESVFYLFPLPFASETQHIVSIFRDYAILSFYKRDIETKIYSLYKFLRALFVVLGHFPKALLIPGSGNIASLRRFLILKSNQNSMRCPRTHVTFVFYSVLLPAGSGTRHMILCYKPTE